MTPDVVDHPPAPDLLDPGPAPELGGLGAGEMVADCWSPPPAARCPNTSGRARVSAIGRAAAIVSILTRPLAMLAMA
jgi:hypothetical protein